MKITTTTTTVRALLAALAGRDADEAVEFVRPVKAATGECWCGCGGTTRGGKFVPGHDSKFHSLAKQVARGLAEMPTEWVCDGAEDDFLTWHDKEVPLHEAREAAKAEIKATKAAAKVTTAKVKTLVEVSIKPVQTAADGMPKEAEVDDLLASMV